MDFSFTAEQHELRRAVRDLARDRASSAQVRAVMDGPTGHDPELWKLVAGELGLAGLTVAEDRGGVGGSFVDAAVVLEEAGRSLLPVPLLASTVAATVLDHCGDDVAAGLASGERIGTLAVGAVHGDGKLSGALRHVIDGGVADLVVVAAPDALWL